LFKEAKMPDRLIPPGYRAALIGSVATIEELSAFAPMEEGAAEGSLMLLQLDFAGFPGSDTLPELEGKLRDAGVHNWPGYPFIVYADTTKPTVYLVWQKGIAWMPVIIGILAMTVLPALLGGFVWLILPQAIKDLINMLINMGMIMLMIWVMTSLIKPLAAPKKPGPLPVPERPRRLEEART
jgi:hypothetical protein